ncbi:tetratricopeptide repeat protein [Halalkalibacter hemicellulosilyticus]|uniref:TPR repeat protein n=1 Tax=Halalkalibacter hemicellulosilyticusJCM 9152 TaxID=1236971 RepID=W4QDQ4_9BACI|nr:hypothetical protein [Halalkalibacter hemicellulosilyticus]GAE30191.1 TPR repeat protein [Halalkalibacter hemicellulosilyticusJCM 9152]
MDKRERKANVILYPGLVKRLIEKGMDSLKDKDGQKALQYFVDAELYESENQQVIFGKMLSLIELGRLQEALIHSKQLLHAGASEYYEVLQVHISLLVQLGDYNEVVQLLEAVLTEEKLPSQYAESFYQLLHFSRQMIQDGEWAPSVKEEDSISEKVQPMLFAESVELQASAISMLRESDAPDATSLLIEYIKKENNDPVLVSLALQLLRDKGLHTKVTYKKGTQTLEVNPSEIDQDGLETFQRAVDKKLEQLVESEDPILLEIARQLCVTYMLAIYPHYPEPKEDLFWGMCILCLRCGTNRLRMSRGRANGRYRPRTIARKKGRSHGSGSFCLPDIIIDVLFL